MYFQTPLQIFAHITQQAMDMGPNNENRQNLATIGQLPEFNTIRKQVQRTRNAQHVTPPNPENLVDLQIPDNYKQYGGQNFILADSGPGINYDIIVVDIDVFPFMQLFF